MIKSFIRNLLITGLVLLLVSHNISGFHINSSPFNFMLLVVVFIFVQIIFKPILQFFLGVLNFLSFGLISLVIDTALLYVISVFFPTLLSFSSWVFPGFDFQGIIVPPYTFNTLGVTFVAATSVSVTRSVLIYLCS